MNVRRHNRPRLALGAALVIACLCALVSGVAAVNLATGSFQIGSAGETASIPIVLDSASGGISGYRITVSISDPSVATIMAVAFPDWAGLKSASALPSGQVVLQAVDLSQQVPVGGTGVLLATLTVKGTATGSTGIVITPDPSMGVQNRNGDLYPIAAIPGTLTVGTPSPGIVPTPVPTAGVSTPIPTPGGSTGVPITLPGYTVAPIATSVPGAVSPGNPTGITPPTVIAPGVQPTFGVGKRYAIGNPGSFIGTRFGSGGTAVDTGGPVSVTEPEATLKPGSRAYGIMPPAGKFIRWYPAARWKAGLK
ncbi:MAG: hypothetical protein ABFC38_02150 [Methanospirillum sp.]